MYHHRVIHHPNMIQCLGSLTDESSVTIITNFINGPNLQNLLFDESHCRVSYI